MRNETITKTIEKVYKDSQMVGYVYKETLALYVKNKKNILRISIKTSIDPDYDYAKIYQYTNSDLRKWESLHKVKADGMFTAPFEKIKALFYSGNLIDDFDKESVENYFLEDRAELLRVATIILE